MRVEYARRRELVVKYCTRMGLDLVEPRGAFYAFPNIAGCGLDDDMFEEATIDVTRRGREMAIVKSGVNPGDHIATRRPGADLIRRHP